MKALFIAGEASGDLHASRLIRALNLVRSDIQFFGIGGDKMIEEGVKIIYPSDKINVIGFTEVFGKLSSLREARIEISKHIKRNHFDFAVTVDFPGFNISTARYLTSNGIPVFYFITPQVWAWGRWRLTPLRKYFKHLFVILPFEEEFFRKESINATYLGHPLSDISTTKGEITRTNLPEGNPLIALLPGSRESEIKRVLPSMLAALRLFKEKHPDSAGVVALHNKKLLSISRKVGENYLDDTPIFCDQTYDILKASDLAIVTSGTATIEAGLFNTPMVVVYKLDLLSWCIAKLLVHIKYISLINLILSEKVIPELLQRDANPERIATALEEVYKNRDIISKRFRDLGQKLGNPGCYDRIAHSLLSMV